MRAIPRKALLRVLEVLRSAGDTVLLPTHLASTIAAVERALTPRREAKSKALSKDNERRAMAAHRARVRQVVFERADPFGKPETP